MTNNRRIVDHPVLGKLSDRKEITFTYDGQTYTGYEGDTIASALLANGVRTLRVHEESGKPRGIYCNIGHCFECRVTVNNETGVRACLTEIKDQMVVESGRVLPSPLASTEHDTLPRTYAEFVKQQEEEKGEV
ncbi:sarcosine oxidase subunit alpha [Cerasibacillus quisquiliarum]|uniref:(2Fe-2S)-binding protein n=1 Tax=Cerasibacillus quisquiliarum TaxID=227865 RepID=A0A511UXP6_9BACI|nr:(2Fe-2S)-binding protein [Cerasibacillus quisquiliarum]MBB5146705.1 sarcosine oxidase subunit alpha [Cerasibacillus quisquiliarum]GEN31405.1 (2Fe-2S)-binding protein [Cerasibacillus quisquiliarum]